MYTLCNSFQFNEIMTRLQNCVFVVFFETVMKCEGKCYKITV